MNLNARQVEIINQLYNLNIPLARGTDEQRRKLTRMIAEQLAFEFGPDWGTKASSPSNPQSKDSISFRLNSQSFDNWDWQNGDTREPQVRVGQPGQTITGQFFIQVNPTNHIGTIPNPPPIPDPPPSDDVMRVLAEIKANQTLILNALLTQGQVLSRVNVQTNDTRSIVQAILDKPVPEPEVKFPEYSGSLFGFNIVLRPRS